MEHADVLILKKGCQFDCFVSSIFCKVLFLRSVLEVLEKIFI